MSSVCLRGFVSGRVQGVSFRQATAAQAKALGLCGWVRNLPDGRVEVLFEGEAGVVKQLAAWLEHGPESARVASLELEQSPVQNCQGFTILR